MTSDSRRLAILTAREINELYGLPCFTDQERCIYFDLSPAEHDAVDAVHTDAAAVHMVLQLGYFKAKRQFFNFYRFGVTTRKCQNCPVRENQIWTILGVEREFAAD
jgi:uncharacterized protein DUF4158